MAAVYCTCCLHISQGSVATYCRWCGL